MTMPRHAQVSLDDTLWHKNDGTGIYFLTFHFPCITIGANSGKRIV